MTCEDNVNAYIIFQDKTYRSKSFTNHMKLSTQKYYSMKPIDKSVLSCPFIYKIFLFIVPTQTRHNRAVNDKK